MAPMGWLQLLRFAPAARPLVEKPLALLIGLVNHRESKRDLVKGDLPMPFLYAFAAGLAALNATVAQAAPPPSDQAIVVEGTRDARHRATDYLDKVLPPVWDAQIGRFEDPLCPKVVGLPDALKDQVIGRIAQVAEVAGIPVNASKCTPNLLIIVVDDKKALIEGMRREKQAYLYGLGSDRVKQLESAARPVAAWQITDVIGADGMPLRVDGDGFPRLFTTVPPSRTVTTTRKRTLAGIVVLEQRGLVGATTRQLADFAMLRLLTPIETKERPAPDSSVLSLFNPGIQPKDAPQSLTWWDLAFLKALRDTRSDMVADAQRDEIRSKIIKEMAKVQAQR